MLKDKINVKRILPFPDGYTAMSWNADKKQFEDWSIYGLPPFLAHYEDEEGVDCFAIICTDYDSGYFDIQGIDDQKNDMGYVIPVKSARCNICKEKMEVEPIRAETPWEDFDINNVMYTCPFCRIKFSRKTGYQEGN